MENIITLVFIGIILLAFLYIFSKMLKKLLINSLVGIVLLFVLHYVFMIRIPITLLTILATALFGIAGVGSLLILHLGGMLC